jgi:hypothetical protein
MLLRLIGVIAESSQNPTLRMGGHRRIFPKEHASRLKSARLLRPRGR